MNTITINAKTFTLSLLTAAIFSVPAAFAADAELTSALTDGKLSGKIGRQVITMDNHRFVGHVGWRQDRQTFDALTLG
jgi:hypothetical protein